MEKTTDRRGTYRRYADRRASTLLAIHEHLFYEPPGPERANGIMDILCRDFDVHQAMVVQSNNNQQLIVRCGFPAQSPQRPATFQLGEGTRSILETHANFNGALTLSRFRPTSQFSDRAWNDLWTVDLGKSATAVLSVPIAPSEDAQGMLWFILNSGSREWSSQDRDLAEEVAKLLSCAIDKQLL